VRLFLDANVVFSAAHSGAGRAQALVRLAEAGYCPLLSSAHALEEATRNLQRTSRNFEERLARATQQIEIVAEAPQGVVGWAAGAGVSMRDAPILAAAVHAAAEYLVTGDQRDFGPLFGSTLRGVKVITLAQALDLVLRRAGT
jgi:predicted nucleic acid-binding protein